MLHNWLFKMMHSSNGLKRSASHFMNLKLSCSTGHRKQFWELWKRWNVFMNLKRKPVAFNSTTSNTDLMSNIINFCQQALTCRLMWRSKIFFLQLLQTHLKHKHTYMYTKMYFNTTSTCCSATVLLGITACHPVWPPLKFNSAGSAVYAASVLCTHLHLPIFWCLAVPHILTPLPGLDRVSQ